MKACRKFQIFFNDFLVLFQVTLPDLFENMCIQESTDVHMVKVE